MVKNIYNPFANIIIPLDSQDSKVPVLVAFSSILFFSMYTPSYPESNSDSSGKWNEVSFNKKSFSWKTISLRFETHTKISSSHWSSICYSCLKNIKIGDVLAHHGNCLMDATLFQLDKCTDACTYWHIQGSKQAD